MHLSSDDAEIFYTVMGDGPPVVLLHPFPANHKVWLPAAELLAGRYRLILPDLRGHGQSSPGAGPATMQKHAADLLRLSRRLRRGQGGLRRRFHRRVRAVRVMASASRARLRSDPLRYPRGRRHRRRPRQPLEGRRRRGEARPCPVHRQHDPQAAGRHHADDPPRPGGARPQDDAGNVRRRDRGGAARDGGCGPIPSPT